VSSKVFFLLGYYRVNYDDENWVLLSRALEMSRHRFSAANRAQLLDDVSALSFAGRLDIETALNMTRFLQYEDDRVVWMSASKNLKTLYLEAEAHSDFDLDHRKQATISGFDHSFNNVLNTVLCTGFGSESREESIRACCYKGQA